MTRHYPLIWRELQTLTRFDKYASESSEASGALTEAAFNAYALFSEKSAEYGDVATPEGAAKAAASFAVDLYNTAGSLGEKRAELNDASDTISQIATVAYLDAMLKTASDGMSGDAQATTDVVRLLGREYGAELLKSLVG